MGYPIQVSSIDFFLLPCQERQSPDVGQTKRRFNDAKLGSFVLITTMIVSGGWTGSADGGDLDCPETDEAVRLMRSVESLRSVRNPRSTYYPMMSCTTWPWTSVRR